MIIDSHTHYTHRKFDGDFPFLTLTPEGCTVEEGNRAALLEKLAQQGICCVEPAISLSSNREVLGLAADCPGRIFPAVGVHPTRTIDAAWRQRHQLDRWAGYGSVVAIGETGLDYHFPRAKQHRLRQKAWFLYQLRLARKTGLPVILHIRDAHDDALRILRRWGGGRGVVHCFSGDAATARAYLALGYHIGIGGALLQSGERSAQLARAVEVIPPERLLLETDSPYILPDCRGTIRPKLLRKTRNTSLILPLVIGKIALLKGMTPREVENITAQNAAALFGLPLPGIEKEGKCRDD